jgi:hypothetical protein
MRPETRIRLFAAIVFVVGIVMVAAGGTMAAWAWLTPDVHLVFRIVLPLAAAWLLFTMIRLALALPQVLGEQERAAPDKEEGDVSSVQEIALPGRVARRIVYADGRTHYRVRPAPRRRHVTPRRAAAAALVFMLAVAGAVAMLEPAGGGVEWLAWLSD